MNSDPRLSRPFPWMDAVACPEIRKGGGGRKSERLFFLAFQFFKGGPSSENSRENDISD